MKVTRRKFLGISAGAGAATALGVRIPLVGGAGAAALAKPNILVIALDDMSTDELGALAYLNSRPHGNWMKFPNYIINTPLCGPSRATTLTGQASHKHGVLFNGDTWKLGFNPPPFTPRVDGNLLPVWLRGANGPMDYRTGLIGKYLNSYPFNGSANGSDASTYVPPGWNGWAAYKHGQDYTNFILRSRLPDLTPIDTFYAGKEAPGEPDVPCPGAPTICAPLPPPGGQPGDEYYSTDLMTDRAIAFLDSASTRPFFLTVCYNAPHRPCIPAEGDIGAPNPTLLRPASYNNLAGKPTWMQENVPDVNNGPAREAKGLLDAGEMDAERRDAWGTLLAVDRGIQEIIEHLNTHGPGGGTLPAPGRLGNTIVFVTSDNGFCHGQFGWSGKQVPYEPSCRTTMMVRHPTVVVPPEKEDNATLVGNIDFAWTVCQLAGVTPGRPQQNGAQSFAGEIDPTFPAVVPTGGRAHLLANRKIYTSPPAPGDAPHVPPYWGLRTGRYKYVEWDSGEKELYDLVDNPDEVDNVYGTVGNETALHNWLEALKA
jgi:arylsulfatase A-like enzyme